MPRKTRMYIPCISAPIVQRGNNHDVICFCDDDYRHISPIHLATLLFLIFGATFQPYKKQFTPVND